MKLLFTAVLAATLVQAQAIKRPRITGVAHVAIFSADVAKTRAFYKDFLGFEEPFNLTKSDGSLDLTFFKINERQYIEVFPEAQRGSDRLNHAAFETDDIEGLRAYLAAKGVGVPVTLGKNRTGNTSFTVPDPDGHRIEFVQYQAGSMMDHARGKFLGAQRVSAHMSHVGILVGALDPALSFYRDVLGFSESWRGSADGNRLSWVNMKVPDGDDYIEFMLYTQIPLESRRGTAHHICLVTPDVARAAGALKARAEGAGYTRPIEPLIGLNRKRLANLYDPDGTRVELMEPGTVDGKPTPSSSAPPPHQ